MRRLFALLRSDGPSELAPQPTLGELDALVAQVREAGLSVDLEVHGEPDAVPARGRALRLSDRAGGAHERAQTRRARSSVGRGALRAESLELEVSDDGRGVRNGSGQGHGLLGMRERVALFGGDFAAASRNGGGFAICARLPFAAPAP
jgi:signal transduction histidine kinase